MITQLTAHILILSVLLPVLLRPFFRPSSSSTRDSASAVPPAAALASILNIAANGANIISVFVCGLALLVFFCNARSFAGLCSGLYLKYYSVPLQICSAAALVLWIITAAAVFFNIPQTADSAGTTSVNYYYTGSFKHGFTTTKNTFMPSARLTIIKPLKETGNNYPVVLFVTDPRLSISDYQHSMTEAAKRGFTAAAAVFNTKDFRLLPGIWNAPPVRPFLLRINRFLKRGSVSEQENKISRLRIMETAAALSLLQQTINQNSAISAVFTAEPDSQSDAQAVLNLFPESVQKIIPFNTFTSNAELEHIYDCADISRTSPADFYLFFAKKEIPHDTE